MFKKNNKERKVVRLGIASSAASSPSLLVLRHHPQSQILKNTTGNKRGGGGSNADANPCYLVYLLVNLQEIISHSTSRSLVLLDETLSKRNVSATRGAGSVWYTHGVGGVEEIQLCNTQAYQCTPAYFADSYFPNIFSSEFHQR
ncbi:hypothetical protein Bca101_080759 [Brassica carinata]